MRERGLGQEVVRMAVREPSEGVRGERRHDEDVCRSEVRIRVSRPFLPDERPERLRSDEAFCARCGDRRDVVPCPDEQAHELARLVGGDPAGDPHEDARHRHIVPGALRCAAESLLRWCPEAVATAQRAPFRGVPRCRRGSSGGDPLLRISASRNY